MVTQIRKDLVRPGYRNLFAPRDGPSAYPEDWEHVVFAANAGLGITGDTLLDWHEYRNHGVLTNMNPATDWVIDGQMGVTLDFKAGTTRVELPQNTNTEIGLPITLEAFIKVRTFNYDNIIATDDWVDTSTKYRGANLQVAGTSGAISCAFGDGGSAQASNRRSKGSPTNVLVIGRVHHVACVIRGDTDMTLLVDGIDVGGNYSGTGGAIAYHASTGGRIGGTGFDGQIGYANMRSGDLPIAHIRAMAQRPGRMWELADDDDIAAAAAAAGGGSLVIPPRMNVLLRR